MAGNSFGCLEAELGLLRSDVQCRPDGVNSTGFFDRLNLGDLAPLSPLSVCPPRASSSVLTLGRGHPTLGDQKSLLN